MTQIRNKEQMQALIGTSADFEYDSAMSKNKPLMIDLYSKNYADVNKGDLIFDKTWHSQLKDKWENNSFNIYIRYKKERIAPCIQLIRMDSENVGTNPNFANAPLNEYSDNGNPSFRCFFYKLGENVTLPSPQLIYIDIDINHTTSTVTPIL